jgi:alpha-tubulin suppressor-like RCC1 family protein
VAIFAVALAVLATGQAVWAAQHTQAVKDTRAVLAMPRLAAATSFATAISVGQSHACAIIGGKAYCWGDNSSGQLGNNNQGVSSNTAVAVDTTGVLAGKTLAQISAGNAFTCALDTAGLAYCWGQNGNGQLGNNSTTPTAVPVAVNTSGVLAGKTLTEISAPDFGSHACALDNTGKAYCWGLNLNGQLGNNSTTQSPVPVAVNTTGVLAGKTLTRVSAGAAFSCGLDNTGKAYCWGLNTNGQLGNSSNTQSLVPVAVTTTGALSGKTLTEVDAGSTFACGLDSTGLAYCWGQNNAGQLGNNSTTDSNVPVAVNTSGALAGKSLTQITTGNGFACALDTTGKAYCWGDNSQGQLGTNNFNSSLVPVAVFTGGVLNGVSLTQISSGTNSTCAMDASSNVYCWGQNGNGQLGNGTSGGPSTVAVKVIGLPTPPGPPTGVTATPGDAKATISWTPPASLGSGTLTGYTATATLGGTTVASCTTTGATSCVITGLTNGTTYTVTVITTTTVGNSVASSAVTVTPQGVLSITVAATATLPNVAPGNTTSAQLGTVTVSDDRGVGSWTATVSATTFTSGANSIALTQVSYWSGPATATSGTGTFTPGQPAAANAVVLTTSRTAFSLTGGSAVNSASWNPTLVVAVPLATVGGAYTATVTHSVA